MVEYYVRKINKGILTINDVLPYWKKEVEEAIKKEN